MAEEEEKNTSSLRNVTLLKFYLVGVEIPSSGDEF
jgi:hypothetical protein